jgi:DNA-binding LacI/PurR family transcriptional regulator
MAADDNAAITGMAVAEKAGISLPTQMSFVGIGNLQTSGAGPTLTTIDLRPAAMAEEGVRLLSRRIEDPSRPTEDNLVGADLVEGESTAPPTWQ